MKKFKKLIFSLILVFGVSLRVEVEATVAETFHECFKNIVEEINGVEMSEDNSGTNRRSTIKVIQRDGEIIKNQFLIERGGFQSGDIEVVDGDTVWIPLVYSGECSNDGENSCKCGEDYCAEGYCQCGDYDTYYGTLAFRKLWAKYLLYALVDDSYRKKVDQIFVDDAETPNLDSSARFWETAFKWDSDYMGSIKYTDYYNPNSNPEKLLPGISLTKTEDGLVLTLKNVNNLISIGSEETTNYKYYIAPYKDNKCPDLNQLDIVSSYEEMELIPETTNSYMAEITDSHLVNEKKFCVSIINREGSSGSEGSGFSNQRLFITDSFLVSNYVYDLDKHNPSDETEAYLVPNPYSTWLALAMPGKRTLIQTSKVNFNYMIPIGIGFSFLIVLLGCRLGKSK